VGLWQGFKWYYELCGVRGIGSVAFFRIFGRPKELMILPRAAQHKVRLRIDTSDFCSYRDVLIFKTKSYDPPLKGFSPQVIVDVGAHIGMSSIYFALKYPAARIIAIEPQPANFQALVSNTAPYKQIFPIQAALWRDDGEVNLTRSTVHPKGAFCISGTGDQRVRSVTMRTLMREAGVDSIDLLKMDIEGAEKEVFAGCDWLDKVRVLAIELHDRVNPGCSGTVVAAAKAFHSWQQDEVTFFVRS
jgi:FkbM family methyltransferase